MGVARHAPARAALLARQGAGNQTVDGVLRERRAAVVAAVESRLQEVLDGYDAGIAVSRVLLQEAKAPAATQTKTAMTSHVHSVECGCKIDGECRNMIEVEGKYIDLTGDIGLGKMEFGGREGLGAKVEGSVQEGRFVATTFELIEPAAKAQAQ